MLSMLASACPALLAVIAGTHHKAYLTANLALNDGPQAAAEHYRVPLVAVYSAMAFSYDNEPAIHEAILEARKLGELLGARSAQSALEEIRARKNAPCPHNYARKRLSIDLSFDTMLH